MLTNEDAWDLTNRLKEAMQNDVCFTQALYQLATPTDIDVLETLIGTAHHLRTQPRSELEERTSRYIQSTDQSMKGRAKRDAA